MRLERVSFAKRFETYEAAIKLPSQPLLEGRLLRMVGLTLEAEGLRAAVGSRCTVINDDSYHPTEVEAEVMGYSSGKLYLMPVGSLAGIAPGAGRAAGQHRTPAHGHVHARSCARWRWARLDGKGGMRAEDWVPMDGPVINPLKRHPISEPLDVGIRSINGLLTVGRGQRLGLFAGTGVGKSVLLGMMTRFTEADIIVVGLIGERGREVKEFIENILGEEHQALGSGRLAGRRCAADASARRAVLHTYRRVLSRQGQNVLLLMDSLTRYARPSVKSPRPSASRRQPRVIRRRYSPSCPARSSAPAMPSRAAVRSPRSIPCSPRATINKTRSPMPRAVYSTAISCCRVGWRRRAITRPSTSRLPSAG